MYYECDLNGTPVSCQLIQWDAVSGKCLIEYTDPIGLFISENYWTAAVNL